nr:reverse transcriptase domain-containing protein [Tanacetum cinerariifolium]
MEKRKMKNGKRRSIILREKRWKVYTHMKNEKIKTNTLSMCGEGSIYTPREYSRRMGLDDPTQGIIDARGIFIYNTPNEAFEILDDKVILKLDFSDDSQNNIKPKTVVSAGGSNIYSNHAMLMDKFKALATKIYSEFLKIREELKEMQYGHRDDEGNQASQIDMRDDTHEFVYKPPSIRNENDKGDVEVIEEEDIKLIPTMPNPSPINSNSLTVSPFLKDCTMRIPYTNAKTFADGVLMNQVGDEEFNSMDGIGN